MSLNVPASPRPPLPVTPPVKLNPRPLAKSAGDWSDANATPPPIHHPGDRVSRASTWLAKGEEVAAITDSVSATVRLLMILPKPGRQNLLSRMSGYRFQGMNRWSARKVPQPKTGLVI